MSFRSSFRLALLAGFAASGLLAGVRTAAATWSANAMLPTPVCTSAGNHYLSRGCADGAGGMFIAWQDYRNGNADLYAQHLDAHGNALWAVNGVPVAVAANEQTNPVLCLDGAGGCYVAWHDYRNGVSSGDVFAVRLASTGLPAAGWAANGLNVSGAQDDQFPQIAADGAGGAYVAYTSVYSSSDSDPRIVHVGPTGILWGPSSGTADTHLQYVMSLVVSGGNAFLFWGDKRGGLHYDLYAQAWNSAGATLMTAGGRLLAASGATDLSNCTAVANGTGGVGYVFDDTGIIYVGSLSADFTSSSFNAYASGLPSPRYAYAAVPDGSGGIFAFWGDYRGGFGSDLYATHVLASFGIAAGWATNGNLLMPAVSAGSVQAVSDGIGGAVVTAIVDVGILAQHLDGSGAPWPLWPSGGRLAGPGNGLYSLTSDGAQGGLLTIDYLYNGSTYGVHAQRVERFSQIGDPAPSLAGVKDVKNDQGGQLKVSWNASSLDVQPTPLVTAYDVWRSVPAAYAVNALRTGAKLLGAGEAPKAARSRAITTQPLAGQTIYWEYVGRENSTTSAGYSFVVPTLGDSIGGSNPYTAVRVRALPGYTSAYWESAPDSGYSVDNLPPVAPAPFAAQYVKGTGAFLTWGPNAEGDLAGYRLYRGSSVAFVPGPGNLVAQLATASFTDAGVAPAYYKLTAYDIHGNESAAALAIPSGTTAVDGGNAPRVVFLAPVAPNPARAGAALRFGLPAAGRAALALFDAAGRRVRTLAEGERAAGEYALAWDGRDESGAAAPSGLYFIRLQTPGHSLVERFAFIR